MHCNVTSLHMKDNADAFIIERTNTIETPSTALQSGITLMRVAVKMSCWVLIMCRSRQQVSQPKYEHPKLQKSVLCSKTMRTVLKGATVHPVVVFDGFADALLGQIARKNVAVDQYRELRVWAICGRLSLCEKTISNGQRKSVVLGNRSWCRLTFVQ